jgi:hypothetical protein
MTSQKKPNLYTRYPLSSVLVYNGATVAHYVLGGIGIILGYASWLGYLLGSLYLAFSFVEMYLHMPRMVCRNCVYYRLDNSRCISGLNLVSRKIAKEGNVASFPSRARGLLCPNNLYIASLAFPILAIIPRSDLEFFSSRAGHTSHLGGAASVSILRHFPQDSMCSLSCPARLPTSSGHGLCQGTVCLSSPED